MKLIKFSQMKRKDDNMTHSANDDSHDDFDDDHEVLILEISEDLVDLVTEKVWILISEIYLEEFFDEDLVEENQKFVNERI
jgi:hypothetical protein